jgi:hypothetical protein
MLGIKAIFECMLLRKLVGWRSTVECTLRISPGNLTCLSASLCEAEIPSRLATWIMLLKFGRLLLTGELSPPELF